MSVKTYNGYSLEVTPAAKELARKLTDCIVPLKAIYESPHNIHLVFGEKEPLFAELDKDNEVLDLCHAAGEPLSLRQVTYAVNKTLDIICDPHGHSGLCCRRWQRAWLAH